MRCGASSAIASATSVLQEWPTIVARSTPSASRPRRKSRAWASTFQARARPDAWSGRSPGGRTRSRGGRGRDARRGRSPPPPRCGCRCRAAGRRPALRRAPRSAVARRRHRRSCRAQARRDPRGRFRDGRTAPSPPGRRRRPVRPRQARRPRGEAKPPLQPCAGERRGRDAGLHRSVDGLARLGDRVVDGRPGPRAGIRCGFRDTRDVRGSTPRRRAVARRHGVRHGRSGHRLARPTEGAGDVVATHLAHALQHASSTSSWSSPRDPLLGELSGTARDSVAAVRAKSRVRPRLRGNAEVGSDRGVGSRVTATARIARARGSVGLHPGAAGALAPPADHAFE